MIETPLSNRYDDSFTTPRDFGFIKFPEFKLNIDPIPPVPYENDGYCSPMPSEEPVLSPPRFSDSRPEGLSVLVPDPTAFDEYFGAGSHNIQFSRRTKRCPPTPVSKAPHRLMRNSSLSDSKILDEFNVFPLDSSTTEIPADSDIFCNEFCEQKEVGRGSFFTVYRVKSKSTGEIFAVV